MTAIRRKKLSAAKKRTMPAKLARSCAGLVSLVLALATHAQEVSIDDMMAMSLDEILAVDLREVRGGEAGSYASRLAEYADTTSTTSIHGYSTTELLLPYHRDGGEITFDQHHSVLAFRTEITEAVTPEISLEYEHAAEEFYLSFAFVDMEISPHLITRVGYFVVPVGTFNEYQYPDFMRRTAQAPRMGRDIIPGLWSEVGLQLRGGVFLEKKYKLNYAFFVSNGLEQPDPDKSDDTIPEGGGIRAMRRNRRDKNTSDKAVGGRVGLQLASVMDIGVSAYTGAYTVDGKRRLSIYDADFSFQRDQWLIRWEAAGAIQEITGGELNKVGTYLLVSYRASRRVELYGQVETIDLDSGPESRERSVLGGVGFYPYPVRMKKTMIKAEWKAIDNEEKGSSGMGMVQLTLSF